ncbi:SRPBCC family protein [Pedobacter gandavensis]|uniref:SRPBCC family protein n=1 Tax=Pedobacter gandavensis TaxID=2679963 RepID=UPI00292CCBFE|nr:SRPBCC family protein [Pedobacter gandavensis]
MKILKVILTGIVGLIVLALIVALFVKKEYAVEREIVINKPKQQVFDYIKFIKNQDNYSVWNRMYPNKKTSYKGTDGTVGFVYAWDDKESAGEQEITKITEGERMDMALRFKVPFEANDQAYMITEAVTDGQTKVKWGFSGSMKYPMNLMILCMNMEDMLGKDLQKGLEDLKVILEK